MTGVKDKLSGRQYIIPGLNSHGKPVNVYASNEKDGQIHLILAGKEAWVNTNDLIDALGLLKYGDEYMAKLKHAKHAKRANNV